MKNKTLVYSIFIGFLVVLSFGFFVKETNAQYSNLSYNPYLYAQNYNNNITSYTQFPTYPLYPLNQNNSLIYPNYSSQIFYGNMSCAPDFALKTYNGSYRCYKYINGIEYSYNLGNNNLIYDQTISVTRPGCLPGYIYSTLTGLRCDSYDDEENILNGEDGTVENFDVRDGDDMSVEEGENNAEVMNIRFDVEDGDVRLDKVEFNFEFNGYANREDLPWNTFDAIRLLSGGEEIASIDCDDDDEWNEEEDDLYSITFSDLEEIIREGDRADLSLEIDFDSSIDGAYYDDISWNIFVPDRGLKVYNGDNDSIYTGDDYDKVSIEISED